MKNNGIITVIILLILLVIQVSTFINLLENRRIAKDLELLEQYISDNTPIK